jgi:uncharacterized protein YqeY
MSLKAQLAEHLKEAMRAKDTVRLETIRAIKGAVTQREVDTQKELDDAAILEIVRSLRKQRIEAIEQYVQGGRQELADKETREKELLESYLPAAPDAATMEATVRVVVKELGASSLKDMSKVVNAAREKLTGADGKALSEVVKRVLTQG